jgi:archaellum component FlaD/FlaE
MKKTLLILGVVAGFMTSCGESDTNASTEANQDETTEQQEKPVEEESTKEAVKIVEVPAELAAINDETRKSEGAVECITQQFDLIKEGKFDEALEYYSAKRKALVLDELAENPAIKDEWKEALESIPQDYYETMIESIKENPEFFVFEDGMWRRTDK